MLIYHNNKDRYAFFIFKAYNITFNEHWYQFIKLSVNANLVSYSFVHLVKIALGTSIFNSLTSNGFDWSMANTRIFNYLVRVTAYIAIEMW